MEDVQRVRTEIESQPGAKKVADATCGDDGSFVLQDLELGEYTVVVLAMPADADNPSDLERVMLLSANVTITGNEPVEVEFDVR